MDNIHKIEFSSCSLPPTSFTPTVSHRIKSSQISRCSDTAKEGHVQQGLCWGWRAHPSDCTCITISSFWYAWHQSNISWGNQRGSFGKINMTFSWCLEYTSPSFFLSLEGLKGYVNYIFVPSLWSLYDS